MGDEKKCKSRVGCKWANKAHALGYYPAGCSEQKKISHKHGKSKKHSHRRPKPVPKKPKKPAPFSTKHSHNFNGPAYPENRKENPWTWYDDVEPHPAQAALVAQLSDYGNHQPSPALAQANLNNSPYLDQVTADNINNLPP